MASSHHSLSSPSISDVMDLLCTMEKQNEEILERNEEILNKLNAIEEDNRQLRQELHEIKSLQNYSKTEHRKHDEPEDEAEHRKENSNNKKARVASLSEPVPDMFDPPASFNTLDDDCLGNVLEFVGKKCYSAFGRVNKRCNEMFCLKGLPKETYFYGYGPLRLIQQQREEEEISKGVLHYNRRDILEWMLTDESEDGYWRLNWLCDDAIEESRKDILREVFQRVNERGLKYLRDCDDDFDLCATAARYGNIEILKFLRENECRWNKWTWYWAKENGHEHILEYLGNNGYPTEWQDDSDSDSE